MANSSILGGTSAPQSGASADVETFGPSDSTDSGSDVVGQSVMSTSSDNEAEWGATPVELDSDSDAFGTGERAQAAGRAPREAADISPDRIVDDPNGDLLDAEQDDVDRLIESLAVDDADGSAATQDPEAVLSEAEADGDDIDSADSDGAQR